MKIPFEFKDAAINRSCFIVYSSKEPYIEVVIDAIESIIKEKENFNVKRLGIHVKSEDSHYNELLDLLNTCTFAVVILDGLRPNVVFEYGILKGLGKPCIVLLENKATVDIKNYYSGISKKPKIKNPHIDMDKNFSDVKDRFYVRYNKNNPKEIRGLIQKEYKKLKGSIEKSFIKTIFPNVELVQKELRDCFTTLSGFASKRIEKFISQDKTKVKLTIRRIENTLNEHNISLREEHIKTIVHLLNDFKLYKDSINLIDILLAKDSNNPFLYFAKANTLMDWNKSNEALISINSALKIAPETEYIWHTKGILLEQKGMHDEAILCYKKGVKYNKNDNKPCSSIHYHYAALLLEKAQKEEALIQIKKALIIEPHNDDYLVLNSSILRKFGRIEDAKKNIEEALSYNENNANAWFRLGTITSNSKKAIEYYDKTISLDANHPGAHCEKAIKLTHIGEADEALKLYFEMNKYCKEYNTCDTLSNNFIYTIYQLYKKSNKNIHNNLAFKKLNKLLLSYRDIKSMNGPSTLNNYGYVLMAFGNFHSSLIYLNKAIKNCSKPSEYALAYYNTGILESRLSKYPISINHLNACISYCKKNNEPPTADCLFIPKLAQNKLTFIEITRSKIDLLKTAIQSKKTINSFIKSTNK
jgi:tetratricopeptide (TPR) repeat protein